MSDQSSSPGRMSNPETRMKSDSLLAEGMGEEENLGADAGAGNAGAPTTMTRPENPLVDDEMSPDDWDGIQPGGPDEVELVSLDGLSQSEAANDNWDDNDDNPYGDSDDALPADSEEAAITQDLLNTTERGRFGDGDAGINQRTEEE